MNLVTDEFWKEWNRIGCEYLWASNPEDLAFFASLLGDLYEELGLEAKAWREVTQSHKEKQ